MHVNNQKTFPPESFKNLGSIPLLKLPVAACDPAQATAHPRAREGWPPLKTSPSGSPRPKMVSHAAMKLF